MRSLLPAGLVACLTMCPALALAWGNSGHRMIGEAAARALPAEIPAFLRTAQAVRDLGELSREPDRSNGAGKVHDGMRNPGHFVDVDDEGKVLGGPPLTALPASRADYETALRAAGHDGWDAGWLPYSIVDAWQQLAKDFAYWRALDAAERNPRWKAHRAWFAADRRRREAQILYDAGALSHFVGDGSQPLHVSLHYNGWGEGPNPGGYTRAKIHAPFEGELVQAAVRPSAVAAAMVPPRSCGCPIDQRTSAYLAATWRLVVPLYELEKAGGLAPGDPRGPTFAARQLGLAASEVRDLMVEAWRASTTQTVGWKPIAVADVLAGKIDPYPALAGVD